MARPPSPGAMRGETCASVTSQKYCQRHLRTAFLMTSAGSLVQMKGVGCEFHSSMYFWIWRTRERTLSKDARRTDLRVRIPNQASTMLIQEAPVGVK